MIGLSRAHQHRRRRVRLVERSHLHEQAQHRLQVGRHLGGRRRALDQPAVRRDRLGVRLGTVEAVQLGQDRAALVGFGIQPGRDLERRDRRRVVLEPRPVDLAQPVPERQHRRALLGGHVGPHPHPLDLPPVGPFLGLPVARRVHQRVDTFEGLQIARVGVERAFVHVDRLGDGAHLVGEDVARGDVIRRAVLRLGLLRQLDQQRDRLLPLTGLAQQLQQAVHDRPFVGPDLQRRHVGRDRPLRILAPFVVNLGDVLQQLALGLPIVGHRQQRLRVPDNGVVVARGLRRLDQRLQHHPAAWLQRQRLLERRDRLGRIARPHVRDAEPLQRGEHLRAFELARVAGQQRLVGRRRLRPFLQPERQRRQIAPGRQRARPLGQRAERLAYASAARARSPVSSAARAS